MSKVIMMKGLPASGKSTEAQKIVEQGNWVRVNRDLLREMLHFSKWSGKNESITVAIEKLIVRHCIDKNINVVVDDTNMNPKNTDMWRTVAQESGASSFAIFEKATPVQECLYRESVRQKNDESVIIKMALRFGKYPAPEKPFVLCDIDGTIANCEHRRHFVEGEKKDWKGFFGAMSNDTPIESTLRLIESYTLDGHKVILLSARPEEYRSMTEEWVRYNTNINPLTIIMRESGDARPDTEVKQDMFNKYFKDKYEIEVMIDDRPSVIRMWKENNVPVMDVGNGVEF